MKLSELKDTPLFEMVNFTSEDTGFKGWTYISTEMTGHDARVKWFQERPGKKAPCVIVTVTRHAGEKPKVENHHLPQQVADEAAKNVEAWIEKNRAKILKFWDEGHSMSKDEVHAFLSTFEKV